MAILDIAFASNALKRKTSMKAILPVDPYDACSGTVPEYDGKPLKSLYLLHGYGGDATDWLNNTDIERYANDHRLAVFLPNGENSFYVNSVALGPWESHVVNELVPFTRRMFNISRETQDTFIAGNSMGGFGALNLGLGHPDTFGKVAALSSALILRNINGMESGYSDLIANYDYYHAVFGDLSCVAGSGNDPLVRMDVALHGNTLQPLYMACGNEDFLLEENRGFVSETRDRGAELIYEEHEGSHDWTFWNTYIEKAIEWMLEEKEN